MESRRLDADSMSPQEAREVVAGRRGRAIDVRDREEYGAGHIPGAIHISVDELDDRLEDLAEDERLIVVCRSGEESAEAAARLRDHGYDAANIDGGMVAWGSDGLPLQPPDD